MATVRFDLEIYCSCGKTVSAREDGGGRVEVDPCDSCLSDEYEKGRTEGLKEAANG